jgi:two-component system phosphate regulon sensor histidine kinase PhoR
VRTPSSSGWGIPLKQQKRIFEKFQRGGLEYKKEKKVSGFGLGLNYVYKVITAMGGNVTVESIEGKYSEFTLTLPVQNENV